MGVLSAFWLFTGMTSTGVYLKCMCVFISAFLYRCQALLPECFSPQETLDPDLIDLRWFFYEALIFV